MCTCADPEGHFLRPGNHETSCPVYVFRCETCDGKGYVFGRPPAANMAVGAWECRACGATGSANIEA